MKKLFFFATMIAATTFGLTSCSDSNGGDSPSGGDGEGQTAYLAVRLSNVGSVPSLGSKPFTRQNTYDYNENVTDGKYINGTPEEGDVTKVRFYLFDSNGEPYYLAGTSQNYLDETVNTTEQSDDPTTIERKSGVVLVIRGESQALPARIAAVANPSSISTGVLQNVMSVDELQAALTSVYATKNGSGTPESFLMTNSVYLDKEGTETTDKAITSTLIDEGKFQKTEDLANLEANAVQIYVERVAARVDVNKGTSNWTTGKDIPGLTTTPATDKDKDVYILTGDDDKSVSTSSTTGTALVSIPQIYVVVDGWGLADENGQAYVEKNLATSYTNLGNTNDSPLSTKDYHRSFWETSAKYSPVRYNFNNYINLAAGTVDALGHTVTAEEAAKNCGKNLEGRTYTLPNTPTTTYSWNDLNRRFNVDDDEAQSPTKVVVAAHLAYNDNGTLKPAEICSYRGRTYITEDYVKSLIVTDVLNSTANNIYIKGTDANGATTYTSLGVNDFKFEPTGDAGTENSYKLTPKLKTEDANGNAIAFAKKTGVDADNNSTYTDYDKAKDAQDALEKITGTDITIYKAGQTYYYTTLQHIWYDKSITDNATKQTNVGAWGVVRNHLYKVTLASISGWGTPVYDATKEIIPVTPKDDKSYLGAQINVLQWRVVEQEAKIDGTVEHKK